MNSKTIGLLSDIHGNLAALEAVVADCKNRGADLIVNLGDCLSGPLLPSQTADYLIAQNWLTLAGNHERQLLNLKPDRMGLSDAYTQQQLSPKHWQWLRSLPPTATIAPDIFLCHGTPTSDFQYYLETVDVQVTNGWHAELVSVAYDYEPMARLAQSNGRLDRVWQLRSMRKKVCGRWCGLLRCLRARK